MVGWEGIVLRGLRGCGVVLTSGSPHHGRLLSNLNVGCRMGALPNVRRACPSALGTRRVPLCVTYRGTTTCQGAVRPSRLVVATSAVM